MLSMEVDFLPTTDPRWKDALDQVAHDVYQLPEYLELSARYEGGGQSRSGPIASAFYVRENESLCLIPLLERSLPPAPDVPHHWRDVTSPYGYAAPVFRGDSSWVHKAIGLFTAECRRRDIVSGFLRMHPFLPVPPALAEYGQLINNGETVYIDLTVPESTLWSQIRGRLRSYINGLKRAGFQTRFDDWSTYGEFVKAYGQTMARLEADQFYCFPVDYFNHLRVALGDKVHLCSVFDAAGKVACGALVTENQGIMQYHLSGTTDDALPWSPSKLMLYEIALWARKRGCTTFHLGGGLGAQADSLLQFKAGFSSLRAAFWTCRFIYDSYKYDYLCARMPSGSRASSYFPQYRTLQSSAP
jgi:hypothetical protein